MSQPASRGPFDCGKGVRCPPPVWEKVEADNGATYYADVATITPSPPAMGINGNQILVYLDDGREPTIGNTDWYTFYCDQPLVLPPGGVAQPRYVPPRSVFGRIRELACTKSRTPDAPASDDVDTKELIQELKKAIQDPEKVRLLECLGVQVYNDPQPTGHPPSPAECSAILARAKNGSK